MKKVALLVIAIMSCPVRADVVATYFKEFPKVKLSVGLTDNKVDGTECNSKKSYSQVMRKIDDGSPKGYVEWGCWFRINESEIRIITRDTIFNKWREEVYSVDSFQWSNPAAQYNNWN